MTDAVNSLIRRQTIDELLTVASSLAAASLQDLGLWRATDIDGGFLQWRAARLPSTRTTTPAGHYVAASHTATCRYPAFMR